VSQIGINTNYINSINNENKSSSGRSHRSKSSPSREKDREGGGASTTSSKFDQPIKPSDSVSQVSSNNHHHHASSRVSERTVKAGSKVHSKSGSRISSYHWFKKSWICRATTATEMRFRVYVNLVQQNRQIDIYEHSCWICLHRFTLGINMTAASRGVIVVVQLLFCLVYLLLLTMYRSVTLVNSLRV